LKNKGFWEKATKQHSNLFKEKLALAYTPTTPTGVLIGISKYHIQQHGGLPYSYRVGESCPWQLLIELKGG
jgi:hypothetical protein